MKQLIITIMFCFLFLFFLSKMHAQNTLRGISFLSSRSQSVNAARRLVGWHRYLNSYEDNMFYGAWSLIPEYSRSYKPKRIAEYFFNTDTLTISGSQITNRDADHILADYFGLSPAFESSVTLIPTIQNVILDLNLYCGYNAWYFCVHAPIVWTKRKFRLDETIFTTGSNTLFPALYMAENPLAAPVISFEDAVTGNVTFGDMQEKLKFGKICGSQTKRGISDIHAILGFNIIRKEEAHLGINMHVAFPTGTRPSSEYLFEPIIGNGKHWEWGLGGTGHMVIWEKDGDQTVSIHLDAYITHLFKACQTRSFDFKANGFGSRYILLKQFDSTGNYDNRLLPTINVTTLPCKVSIGIQSDIVAMLGYIYRNFGFDIGYNLWARTRERVTLHGSIESNKFGFKGTQDARNNNTQNDATLNGIIPATADAAQLFISTSDLDVQSTTSPSSLTHKIFLHFNYSWEEKEKWVPYLGIGSEIEFEGIKPKDSQPDKNSVSQWGIWLKGGCIF